jgi:hypothetical protein
MIVIRKTLKPSEVSLLPCILCGKEESKCKPCDCKKLKCYLESLIEKEQVEIFRFE